MSKHFEEIIRRLNHLEKTLEEMSTKDDRLPYVEANVSIAPTDAELDAAFGTPGTVPYVDGFTATLYDTTGGTVYRVTIGNDTWHYEVMTLAT